MEHDTSAFQAPASLVVVEIVAYLEGVLATGVERPGVFGAAGTDSEEETILNLDHSVRRSSRGLN